MLTKKNMPVQEEHLSKLSLIHISIISCFALNAQRLIGKVNDKLVIIAFQCKLHGVIVNHFCFHKTCKITCHPVSYTHLSVRQFMLLAVYIPEQEPQVGHALFSYSSTSSMDIFPAAYAPTASNTVSYTHLAVYKRQYIFKIVPPGYPKTVSTPCSFRHSITICAPVNFIYLPHFIYLFPGISSIAPLFPEVTMAA